MKNISANEFARTAYGATNAPNTGGKGDSKSQKAVAYRRIADSHCAKAYGGEDAIAEAVAVSRESDDRRRTKK